MTPLEVEAFFAADPEGTFEFFIGSSRDNPMIAMIHRLMVFPICLGLVVSLDGNANKPETPPVPGSQFNPELIQKLLEDARKHGDA